MRLFAVMAGVMLLAVTPARSAPPCPDPLLRPDEIPQNDKICGERGLENFAHLAWRAFTTLVWPAASGSRGKSDKIRPITDMSGPRVFETYKSDWKVFPAIAADLRDWDTYPSEATFCKGYVPAKPGRLPDGSLVLGSLDKFDSVAQPGGGAIAAHVLMAQNGSLVRYLAAFNEKAFNLIKNFDLSVNFWPVGRRSKRQDKSRGRHHHDQIRLDRDNELDPRSGLVSTSAPPGCRTHRAGNASRRKSGWSASTSFTRPSRASNGSGSSFEHVNNVPLRGDLQKGGFTFNSGTGIPMPFAPHRTYAPGRRLCQRPTTSSDYMNRVRHPEGECDLAGGAAG